MTEPNEKEKDSNATNFVRYMSNPRAFILRKWLYDLIGVSYVNHDQIVERISSSLTTEKDVQDFGKLIGEVYQMAYLKAVNDYKEKFETMGVKVQLESPVVIKHKD